MNRRTFIGAVGLLPTPLASFVWAQSASRVYRIGTLESIPVASLTAPTDGLLRVFLGRLQELGYAEGWNLVVERRTSEGRNARCCTKCARAGGRIERSAGRR